MRRMSGDAGGAEGSREVVGAGERSERYDESSSVVNEEPW